MNLDDLPKVTRVKPPEPRPEEVPFVPHLAAEPLDLPPRVAVDPVLVARRARAEHLCLWLGCSKALCRRTRHCLGPHAACVFEMPDVAQPLL